MLRGREVCQEHLKYLLLCALTMASSRQQKVAAHRDAGPLRDIEFQFDMLLAVVRRLAIGIGHDPQDCHVDVSRRCTSRTGFQTGLRVLREHADGAGCGKQSCKTADGLQETDERMLPHGFGTDTHRKPTVGNLVAGFIPFLADTRSRTNELFQYLPLTTRAFPAGGPAGSAPLDTSYP